MSLALNTNKMESEENSYRSHLPQPTKFLTPANILSEISETESNIRAKPSYTPATSIKHKIMSSYEEPAPKRKTLAERAGETRSNAKNLLSESRMYLKGVPLVRPKSSLMRDATFSHTTRAKLGSTREISAGSLTRSVIGSEKRPVTAYTRPKSVLSQSSTTRPISCHSRSRTLTTNERFEDVARTGSVGWTREEWDVEGRIKNMEVQFLEMQETIKGASIDKKSLEESMIILKARNAELEANHCQLVLQNKTLHSELDSMRHKAEISHQSLLDTTKSFNEQIRSHQLEFDDMRRQNRNEVEKVRRDGTEEIDRLLRQNREQIREFERRAISENDEKIREIERRNVSILEEEKNRVKHEIREIESRLASETAKLELIIQQKDLEIQNLRNELARVNIEFERERESKASSQNELALLRESNLKKTAESSTTIQSLEHTLASLRARIAFLESGSKAQSDSFAEMEARLEKALNSAQASREKLIKEESIRRSLFNQIQELKGNIRVMCRVRPVLCDTEGESASIQFPDIDKESKELELLGKEEKSSLGNVSRKIHSFSFDRVFGPESQNQDVFEEISQLVQSALDGYNVCIFCYGQTGSGKTHTMSSSDGMIPRATQQIYETATNLREKGWLYTMEGNFVEVYNEEIHDLLCTSKDSDKKKHEIRHDEHKKQTLVTGLNTVSLDSPASVENILRQASNNRSVAATKSNERSSRSHSVFMLKLFGRNNNTNERSEGTLNLVDLAGSERLKQSGAEGDRMKETQSINKSLSCLGDVIAALGQGKEGMHIPYRNSKLTYLLQYSLGGNSKTLMFVMASPLEAHLSETLSSLKFATKVTNIFIHLKIQANEFRYITHTLVVLKEQENSSVIENRNF